MVNLAGRMLYVGLGGAIASGIGQDDPDVRIIRGACNALCDQAGEQRIDPMRRASLVSGLQAVARLMPKVSTRALTDSACELELRLRRGDVMFSDFEEQML